jgi:hypothetical protein
MAAGEAYGCRRGRWGQTRLIEAVLSTVLSIHNISRMDGTVSRPGVPFMSAEDSMSADDCQGRQKYCHRPSSTVTGRHRVVTNNTYTVTVEHAVQDINRFNHISRLSISCKNSDFDRADVDGSCFTSMIVEKCSYSN